MRLMQATPLRNSLLGWLEKQGKNIHGSILHAGSGSDAYRYHRFFPHATRYRNLDREKHVNVNVVADIQDMPRVPSRSESCILCVFTLHQVSNVNAALKEFNRVLEPRGVFLGEFTAPGWENKTEGCNRWTSDEALNLVRKHFTIKEYHRCFERETLVSTFIKGDKTKC